tara:strand:- start:407 stop:1288 length:882 start_codon:yes stop_codon:yes gene_type:complete
MFRKAFPGGTAGRSIRTTVNAATSFNARLFNIDATESTDGVWNGGMTIAEAAGSANADRYISSYMDTSENVWYMLFTDTSTTPDTYYFSKVNEAGTVTAIGNDQVGNASFDGACYTSGTMGTLRRLGGDGSGNFGFYFVNTSGGNAAAAAPFKGAAVTIDVSDGSLSYANMMPATFGNASYPLQYPRIGPTANNIVAGVHGLWWGSTAKPQATAVFGGLANLTNGKAMNQVNMGGPSINGVPWTSGYYLIVERAATIYTFGNYYGNGVYGPTDVNVDELHAWVDEMAVYYGIL